jgi:hypothetical protein
VRAPPAVAGSDSITNGTVEGFARAPSGQILMIGAFTQVSGAPRARIARLEPTGALDLSAPLPGIRSNGTFRDIAVDELGRVYVTGHPAPLACGRN